MASCDKGISEKNFSSIKTKVYMEQSPINIKSNARVFSNDPFTAMTLYSAVKSTKEQVASPTPGRCSLATQYANGCQTNCSRGDTPSPPIG